MLYLMVMHKSVLLQISRRKKIIKITVESYGSCNDSNPTFVLKRPSVFTASRLSDNAPVPFVLNQLY